MALVYETVSNYQGWGGGRGITSSKSSSMMVHGCEDSLISLSEAGISRRARNSSRSLGGEGRGGEGRGGEGRGGEGGSHNTSQY